MSWRSQDASSQYDSMQAKVEERFSRGLWYLVSYTFSRNFAWAQNAAVGGIYAWEKSPASFDVPHNVAASFGYELPFGKGKPFLNQSGGALGKLTNNALGGWQLTSTIIYRSGLAYTPSVSRDVANTGVGGQRPNRTCSGQLENPTLTAWFDKNCFTVPANFTYGNSGSSILRSDYRVNVSTSLSKQFAITERSRLQFRAEAFNLSNTAYFGGPSTNVDTATVGRVTSANTPRQIQFGLKINF